MAQSFVVIKHRPVVELLISRFGTIGVEYTADVPLSIPLDRVAVLYDVEMGVLPTFFMVGGRNDGTIFHADLVDPVIERFGKPGESYHEYHPLVLVNVTISCGYDEECGYWFAQISADVRDDA